MMSSSSSSSRLDSSSRKSGLAAADEHLFTGFVIGEISAQLGDSVDLSGPAESFNKPSSQVKLAAGTMLFALLTNGKLGFGVLVLSIPFGVDAFVLGVQLCFGVFGLDGPLGFGVLILGVPFSFGVLV
ncbi:hypothetical protein DPMN_118522 [Dreissena polymorpha]|uniref:Uncharacterized protein n=1 Tax=Dreissena polymorpha TaxID=45954 RepID=A0A9D4JR60_DREPO|nr:hypothetical protein DPMN_118522 [Dreissena polymorpha]